MTCNEFQSLMMPFIHGKLSIQKKEEILMHLSTCPKCAEELEIYYIIVNCIKGLDDEIDFPDDYHSEYHQFLQKAEWDIKLRKKKYFRHKTAFSAVLALAVILTGVSFHTNEDDSVEKSATKMGKFDESDLEMRFRFRDHHVFFENALDIEKLKINRNLRGR